MPANESGNNFDKLFYGGYYLYLIDISLAEFFLTIKNIKTKKEYISKLIPIIEKINPNLSANVFKFKINYSTDFPQCAWSLMRMKQIRNGKTNEKNEIIRGDFPNEEDNLSDDFEDEMLEEERIEEEPDKQTINNLGKEEEIYLNEESESKGENVINSKEKFLEVYY